MAIKSVPGSGPLTANYVAQRLSSTQLPKHLEQQAFRYINPQQRKAWFPEKIREAAVLIALIPREDGLRVLLTERTP